MHLYTCVHTCINVYVHIEQLTTAAVHLSKKKSENDNNDLNHHHHRHEQLHCTFTHTTIPTTFQNTNIVISKFYNYEEFDCETHSAKMCADNRVWVCYMQQQHHVVC